MIDWQSYLDGSMSSAEKAALDSRLARDSQLRSELEGFKAFRSALGEAGKQVVVPHAKLQASLSMVASAPMPKPPFKMPWIYALGATAAAVISITWYVMSRDPMSIAQSPTRDSNSSMTSTDASLWIRSKVGLAVPAFELEMSGSKFEGVEVGDDWGCLKYSLEGQPYRIYVSRKDHFDDFAKPQPMNGTQQYSGAKGIGWRANGLSYYLAGSYEIVNRMSCELEKQSMKPAAKQRIHLRTQ